MTGSGANWAHNTTDNWIAVDLALTLASAVAHNAFGIQIFKRDCTQKGQN
jgi:succinate dehydrogenase hydrophobic anchor subunit